MSQIMYGKVVYIEGINRSLDYLCREDLVKIKQKGGMPVG